MNFEWTQFSPYYHLSRNVMAACQSHSQQSSKAVPALCALWGPHVHTLCRDSRNKKQSSGLFSVLNRLDHCPPLHLGLSGVPTSVPVVEQTNASILNPAPKMQSPHPHGWHKGKSFMINQICLIWLILKKI